MLNIIDYGYWIYYAKTPGFAFCPTLLVLVAVIIACVLRASLIWAKMKNARSTALAACLALVGITASTFVGQWNLNNHTCSIRTTLFDSNFRHEMSMYRALDELRFEDAVKESESYGEQPTNLMVMYKNIALMHTGRLTEMFKNTNIGIRPNTQSSPKVRTSRLGAPLILYVWAIQFLLPMGYGKCCAIWPELQQREDDGKMRNNEWRERCGSEIPGHTGDEHIPPRLGHGT